MSIKFGQFIKLYKNHVKLYKVICFVFLYMQQRPFWNKVEYFSLGSKYGSWQYSQKKNTHLKDISPVV